MPPRLFFRAGELLYLLVLFSFCFGCLVVAVPPLQDQWGDNGTTAVGGLDPSMCPPLLRFLCFPSGGLCLLGAYADSDDEEGETTEKSARLADANGNNSADIDSTLANFLAVSAELGIFLCKGRGAHRAGVS